jgi:anti-sigma factor RsiW
VTDRSQADEDLRCIEVAEAVSAYLDGAVDEGERRRIERHLAGCLGCSAALDQFRTVIDISGELTAADIADVDPLLRDRLAATLRSPRRK